MSSLSESLVSEFLRAELERLRSEMPGADVLRADLHLHDEESRVPDERLGKLLGFRETWATVDQQRRSLRANGVELLTITNHNNARTCWDLLDAGHDILPGAEFTCHFKNLDLSIHVLTYGFSPEQEARLATLRRDAIAFLSFCGEHALPTTLAHPLYFYSRGGIAPADFDILSILFDRFEVVNGQREPLSNWLALEWARSLTPERRSAAEKRFGLKEADFCRLPTKAFTGGSDDHFALYSGGTTTLLDVSSFPRHLARSERARLALLEGRTCPSGASARLETIALGMVSFLAQVLEFADAPTYSEIARRPGSPALKWLAMGIAKALRFAKPRPRRREQARSILATLEATRHLPLDQKLSAHVELLEDWKGRRDWLRACFRAVLLRVATRALHKRRQFGGLLAAHLGVSIPRLEGGSTSLLRTPIARSGR